MTMLASGFELLTLGVVVSAVLIALAIGRLKPNAEIARVPSRRRPRRSSSTAYGRVGGRP